MGAQESDVARIMHDEGIGAVVVVENGIAAGLVTDRDIVVRAVADGRDPNSTPVGEIASRDLRTLAPDQDVEDAIRLMREWDVRRVVVVQDGRPVGIVSLGDLAIERDRGSVLADASRRGGAARRGRARRSGGGRSR